MSSRHGPRRKQRLLLLYPLVPVETCLFAESLLNNGCCIIAYLAVVAEQRVYMTQYILCSRETYCDCVKQDKETGPWNECL
jgi:hypothetical protein